MVRHGARLLLALGFAFTLAAARADTPPVEPSALATLETMVANLGYKTTEDANKQSFWVTWSGAGNYDYKMHFDLSQDATLAYAYVNLATFTPAQLAKLQFVKILEASDSGDFYFSMESSNSGEALYANAMIPLAGLTPENLRSTLTDWSGSMDSSDNLWDTSLWK